MNHTYLVARYILHGLVEYEIFRWDLMPWAPERWDWQCGN